MIDKIDLITHPDKANAQSFSAYFTRQAKLLPNDCKDEVLKASLRLVAPNNLHNFTRGRGNYFCAARNENGRIVAGMFASFRSATNAFGEGWLDPVDHMLMFFFKTPNTKLGRRIGNEMLFGLYQAANDHGCQRIEMLTHVSDVKTFNLLSNHGFVDAGLVKDNNRNAIMLSAPHVNLYRRMQLYGAISPNLIH